MTEPATIWTQTLGCELRYWDAAGVRTRTMEAGQGPVLFLLHGTGGHVEAFAKNMIPLAEHFRVVAVDMIGHGLTAKPDIEYVLPDYTQHLRDLMDAMGIAKAHWLGESLGGWVATWLALESPERVNRLINCTGGVFRWPEGEDPREAEERRNMVSKSQALKELTRLNVRKRLEMLFHDPDDCTEELVDIRLALYSRPEMQKVVGRLHHMLPYDSPARAEYSLTEERLREISVPTLYLWGEYNPGSSVASATRAAEMTRDAELVVLDDTAHWPQWEDPSGFDQAVVEFLSSVRST